MRRPAAGRGPFQKTDRCVPALRQASCRISHSSARGRASSEVRMRAPARASDFDLREAEPAGVEEAQADASPAGVAGGVEQGS